MRLALLLTLTSQAIFAQTPACDGNIVIVRVSEIKPGQMDTFMAAVAAHKAWYRTNGIKDNEMVVSRVIVGIGTSGADPAAMRLFRLRADEFGIPVTEKRMSRDEFYIADEAFFTGTAAEVTPIRELDGRVIGDGGRGPGRPQAHRPGRLRGLAGARARPRDLRADTDRDPPGRDARSGPRGDRLAAGHRRRSAHHRAADR